MHQYCGHVEQGKSAAASHGPVTGGGWVLSRMLQDATAGLQAVVDAGGVGLVQDPATAAFPSMPTHAARCVHRSHVLALDDLAAEVVRLVETPLLDGARS